MTTTPEEQTSEFRYFHVRNRFNNMGGFTIAVWEELNSVRYAVSYCSKKDHFCKKTGRWNSVDKFEDYFVNNKSVDSHGFKTVGEVIIHTNFRNPLHMKYHILLDILFSDETKKPFVKNLITDELFFMSNPI